MKDRVIIEFAGPDGSGKTTQMRLLGKYVREKGHPVCTFTFDSKPLSRLIVFAMKRLKVVHPLLWVVLNALNDRLTPLPKRGFVLFDKYYLQNEGQARALVVNGWFLALFYPSRRRPTVSFVMSLDPEIAYGRKARVWGTECGTTFTTSVTSRQSVGRETFSCFQRLLLMALLQVCSTQPQACLVLDASKSSDSVGQAVLEHVQQECKARLV